MNKLKKAVILMAILTLVASFYTAIVLTAETSETAENGSSSDNQVHRDLVPEWIDKVIYLGPVWAVVGVGWVGLGIVIIRRKKKTFRLPKLLIRLEDKESSGEVFV